jgi:hypothetical protein
MRRSRNVSAIAVPAALLTWSLLAMPAFGGTTGRLQGRVVEGDGTPLPGVSIAASSPAQIGGEQLATTDLQGEFRFPNLAPGSYSVVVELDGFVIQELTAVQVRVDRTTELHVTLSEATFEDEIVVVETTPVVDPEQTSTGQTFTGEYLKKASIGTDGRSYLAVSAQAAGVEQDGAAGGTFGLRVHGSDGWENAFLIDGTDTQDTWGGGVSFDTGFDAIQEITVHTAGFGAEYGLATGGVVNVVTRSGGNEFSATLDLRYRDSDFETSGRRYDPDEEPADRQTIGASFGGPLLRDRLWFFLSGSDLLDRTTPINTPYSVDTSNRSLLGKLTWQAAPDWSLAGRYLDNSWPIDRYSGNQFRPPETTYHSGYEANSSVVDLTGVLSPALVWSLQLSDFDTAVATVPQSGDLTTIPHRNVDSGLVYGNALAQFHNDWGRLEAETDLSWFVPVGAGSHEIKAGVRYSELYFAQNQCRNGSGRVCTAGDAGFTFWDGVDPSTGANIPFWLQVIEARGHLTTDGWQRSAWVNDTWRLRSNVTLSLGLRWDEARQKNRTAVQSVEFDQLQPRLGAAWDVMGDGRNILRASWGRFMHPSTLALSDLWLGERSNLNEWWISCSVLGLTDPADCAAAAGSPGLYRTDPESWDPAGWLFDGLEGSAGQRDQVVPGLDPMHVDQLVLGFERELFRRTSLELSYIHKEWKDLMEDTCIGNYPTPSPDADCSTFLLANLPEAKRDYEAWVLRFESRALDRFHGIASWVYSESKGSHDGFISGWDFAVYPFHYENRYGYLADHSRHRVKLNGFVELPWDLLLGVGGYWQSEQRWTPTVPGRTQGVGGTIFLEPRGSRKEDGLYNLDLQLSKGVRIGPTRLELIGSIYNALDTERPLQFCSNLTGCGDFALGDPLDWQRPRRYEVGLRLEFR